MSKGSFHHEGHEEHEGIPVAAAGGRGANDKARGLAEMNPGSPRILVFVACLIALLSVVACAGMETNRPAMSKEEAIRVLQHVDPYSTNAMNALSWHRNREHDRGMERRDEQCAQLDLELLGITSQFGKPPRSGPWPEAEFQALLKRQADLKRARTGTNDFQRGSAP